MKTYGKLREKIRQNYGTITKFSAAIGSNVSTMSQKLNGKSDWTSAEIEKTCALLRIPIDSVHEYFFYK